MKRSSLQKGVSTSTPKKSFIGSALGLKVIRFTPDKNYYSLLDISSLV
jgi:hypothetical protein